MSFRINRTSAQVIIGSMRIFSASMIVLHLTLVAVALCIDAGFTRTRTTTGTHSTSTTTTPLLDDATVETDIQSHKFIFIAGITRSGGRVSCGRSVYIIDVRK